MQSFILTSAIALMAGSTMAAPTSCSAPAPVAPASSDTVYQIRNFYERKPDGQDIASLSFDILATNGGTLDFNCIPYDQATGTSTTNFEDGKVYPCGNNTLFGFSYSEKSADPNKGKLFLWQGATAEDLIQGNTTIPTPYCHAGGAGPLDMVCFAPETSGNITITMTVPGQ
jgi:hypothetical protein